MGTPHCKRAGSAGSFLFAELNLNFLAVMIKKIDRQKNYY